MISERSKSAHEVEKVAGMLEYRGVRKEVSEYLAKHYNTQYIISQCKQQDRDAKSKHYRSFAGDIVSRIRLKRKTPDFPVQEEPDRRPYDTCPFVDADNKCWRCYWYDSDKGVCCA